MRLYTQNVDGIESSLPPLATEVPLDPKAPWPRTIQLHGGLEKMMCHKCQHTSDLQPELFEGAVPPECSRCAEVDNQRIKCGQRSRGVGRLRPRIVLYNESNPDEEAIGSVVMSDLRARPDALVVVGTSMKIPGVKRIVKEMSRVVHTRKDGASIWINRDTAPVNKELASCFDLVVKGNCDDVARQVALKMWWEEEDENGRAGSGGGDQKDDEKKKKTKKSVPAKQECAAQPPPARSPSLPSSAAAAAAAESKFSVVVRGDRAIKPTNAFTSSTSTTTTTTTTTSTGKVRKKPPAKASAKAINAKAASAKANVNLKSQFRVGKASSGAGSAAAAAAPVKKNAS